MNAKEGDMSTESEGGAEWGEKPGKTKSASVVMQYVIRYYALKGRGTCSSWGAVCYTLVAVLSLVGFVAAAASEWCLPKQIGTARHLDRMAEACDCFKAGMSGGDEDATEART